MSNKHADIAMKAVSRVRAVHERESRIGLQRALTERREASERVESISDTIASATTPSTADSSSFVAQRGLLMGAGVRLHEAKQDEAAASAQVSTALQAWQGDKTRLRAVELLLDRRAAAARQEALRLEAQQLDELASQRWARTRGGDHA